MKQLSPDDIRRLAERHLNNPFCARDAALIAMAGMAYFNARELSMLRVADLVDERRGLISDGYLPSCFSSTGKTRYFVIGQGTYLSELLQQYIDWRKDNGHALLDCQLYDGLNPGSYFFLKDNGDPFTLNFKNRFDGDAATQALQMQRHFKTFVLGPDVDLRKLNDSFIANFWVARCQSGSAQAVRDLVELTGLSADTIREKCIRSSGSVKETLEELYR